MRPKLTHPAYVLAYAGLTSMVFTAAIMALSAATAGIVERNEKLLTQRALVAVFFGADTLAQLTDRQVSDIAEDRIDRREITDPATGKAITLLTAYSTDKRNGAMRSRDEMVGYGLGISGVGFWARIDGVLAVEPDLNAIKGVRFLNHSETPGLGGRITTDEFLNAFAGLNVSEPASGGRFIYIGGDKVSGATDPRYGRRVDAITGATGTSKAVEEFLNADIAAFRRAMAAAGLTNSGTEIGEGD